MAIEFDLLYRWHSLLPKRLQVGAHEIPIKDSLGRTDILTEQGLRTFMLDASAQRAGRVSLFNTDEFLVSVAERPTVEAGRRAQLRSFNDYRELCGLPRLKNFGQFSTSKKVGKRLCKLYDHVDDVEYYVGLFAEEAGRYEVLPPLMTVMVGSDAFSQALMNPLLGPQMDGELTFSQTGLDIIADTKNLESVIRRNVGPCLDDDYFSLTRKGYVGP
jgi:prostaglandin-endoperoxide synthase 2